MAVNFGHPASWALGLGVLGGAIVGSIVPASTPGEELRHVFGFMLLFGPVIYVLVTRRERYWEAKHPYLRFGVYTLSLTTAAVFLVRLVLLLPLGTGNLASVVEFLAGLGAFAVTVYVTFYGGAERVWDLFLSRTDTEW